MPSYKKRFTSSSGGGRSRGGGGANGRSHGGGGANHQTVATTNGAATTVAATTVAATTVATTTVATTTVADTSDADYDCCAISVAEKVLEDDDYSATSDEEVIEEVARCAISVADKVLQDDDYSTSSEAKLVPQDSRDISTIVADAISKICPDYPDSRPFRSQDGDLIPIFVSNSLEEIQNNADLNPTRPFIAIVGQEYYSCFDGAVFNFRTVTKEQVGAFLFKDPPDAVVEKGGV